VIGVDSEEWIVKSRKGSSKKVSSEEWIVDSKKVSSEEWIVNSRKVASEEWIGNSRTVSSKSKQAKAFIFFLFLFLFTTHYPLSTAFSQTLPSFFTDSDLQTLEQLIAIAEQNDLQILEYMAELGTNESSLSFQGRLGEALSVNAGTSISGSYYGQAELSYSLSVSLDVMDLLTVSEGSSVIEQRIVSAKLNTRVRVVEAFVAYKIALVNAETRARAVEASQARYEVAVTRVQAGESILSSQINAQSDLASAGLSLYSANGDVIVSLEKLAAVVGVSPFDMSVLLKGQE